MQVQCLTSRRRVRQSRTDKVFQPHEPWCRQSTKSTRRRRGSPAPGSDRQRPAHRSRHRRPAGQPDGVHRANDSNTGGASAEVTAGTDGTDDGTTLTLWTRAPLEKQANLLVDAYNASHENQVDSRACRTTTTWPRSARPLGDLPDLFAANGIVYVPNWVKQGLFQDLTTRSTRCVQGRDQPGPPEHQRRAGRQGARAAVRAGPLDAVLEQGPVQGGRALDPDTARQHDRRRERQGDPGAGKPDTYGTATGLNCGGYLVFTWFPSVWADGEQVMNDEIRLLASDTAKNIYADWKEMWDAGTAASSSKDEAGPTWTAVRRGQGRPDVLPGDPAVLDHGRRRRRGRHPRPGGRRLDVRRW